MATAVISRETDTFPTTKVSRRVGLTPIPKYTGPIPRGITTPGDLSFFETFVALDALLHEPANHQAYLLYSGSDGDNELGNSLSILRMHIKAAYNTTVTAWNDVYNMARINPNYGDANSPNSSMKVIFDQRRKQCYGISVKKLLDLLSRKTPPVKFLEVKCLSWAIARRAALRGGVVHLAMWKGAPLCSLDSYWGAYEIGILTGPKSKVEMIVRHDVEIVPNPVTGESGSTAVDPAVVVWQRGVHRPLGIDFEAQDWATRPKDLHANKEPVWVAKKY